MASPGENNAPHPLVTLAGILIAFALLLVAIKTTLLPRTYAIIAAICFTIVFRWFSRLSARATRARRQQRIEQLKRTPVLGLDD